MEEAKYATYTERYGLMKPGDEDFYDVGHINTNMDTIDAALGNVEDTVIDVGALIGATTDKGGTETAGSAMAKLNALLNKVMVTGVGIKKVQRGYFAESGVNKNTKNDIKINLSTINPNKTFIILRGGTSAGESGNSSGYMGHIKSVTTTSFTYTTPRVYLISGIESTISYEVVEFY